MDKTVKTMGVPLRPHSPPPLLSMLLPAVLPLQAIISIEATTLNEKEREVQNYLI